MNYHETTKKYHKSVISYLKEEESDEEDSEEESDEEDEVERETTVHCILNDELRKKGYNPLR